VNDTSHQKQFVAWARVSSIRQKKEGFSLEDQEQRLDDFAKRLDGVVVKLFKIAETASKREERTTFREFTTYVKRNSLRLAGMLFVKVDRAARNIRDWAELEELSESSDVPLFFPDQPSAETPAGRMQRRMSAVFASYQTDQQATDIRAGQKRRVESGLPLGRQYGYRLVRVNGRSLVEHDPIQSPKVRRIFELYAHQPLTLYELIDLLARQGVPYTDRQPRFDKSVLYRILTNRVYLGEVGYQGQWYPGTFAPLVERETFQLAQDRLGGRVMHKPQITFAGQLMRCGHCGHVVTGEKKRKKSPDGTVRHYTYYRCTHYHTPGHPRVRMTEMEVDRQFVAVFADLRIDDPAIRQWFTDVIRTTAHHGQRDNDARKTDLLRQQQQVDLKLKTLLDLRMENEIGADEYAAKRAELRERQSAIRLQLEVSDLDAEQIADRALAAFELSQSLVQRWVKADYTAKRTILEIMVKSALLNSENIEISLKKPFDVLSNGLSKTLSGGGGN